MTFSCAVIHDEKAPAQAIEDFENLIATFDRLFACDYYLAEHCPQNLHIYDLVVFFSGVVEQNMAKASDAIFSYVQTSKKSLLLCAYSSHAVPQLCLGGPFGAHQLHPFTTGGEQSSGELVKLGNIVQPFHPIMLSVKRLTIASSSRITDSKVAVGAQAIAYWSDDVILAAEREMGPRQSIIALNMHASSNEVYGDAYNAYESDGRLLIHNAMLYCARKGRDTLPTKLKKAAKIYADVIILV